MALTKVTTGTIADDSIQSLKNKNLIINGAMNVAQRGTSATIGNPTFVCDRFRLQNTTIGSFTASQSTNAPDGFSNSLRIYCDTAEASPAASDIFLMYYRPEGQDLQHIQKGTAGAKSLTVSFWVRSNKTGTYCNWLFDYNNSRSYTTSYSISSANTWTYVTKTFAGDTTGGTLNNDTLRSMELSFGLSSGTDYSSGALTNAWAVHSATNICAGQTNLADAVGNYWEITGIQLEVGDVATPFEHRSYGEELALCQRYYWQTNTTGSTGFPLLQFPAYTSGSQHSFPIMFPTIMRAIPTVGKSGSWVASGVNQPTISADYSSKSGTVMRVTSTTTGSALYTYPDSTDDYIYADAEV